MFVLRSVVVLAVTIQVISSQGQGPPPDMPAECREPPKVVERPHDCCKIPPLFEEKDFEECGFKKLKDGQGPPGPPRGPHGPHDCSKQLCIMEKYELAKDGEVDDEAVQTFLDSWADKNDVFKDAMKSAKENCVGKDLPGPPHVCKANKQVFCISHTLFDECPVWEETDGCKTLKEHWNKCRPYFKKPHSK